jgi:hypothetical protein
VTLQSITESALLGARKFEHSASEDEDLSPDPDSVATTSHRLRGKLLDMVQVRPDGVTVRVNSNSVVLQAGDPATSKSRLILTDVPLAGYARIAARILASGREAVRVTLSILDQEVGDVIGTTTTRLGSGDSQDLGIDLHGIHCLSSISLQIAGRSDATIRLKSFVIK